MRAVSDSGQVVLTLDLEEAGRLAAVMAETTVALSRREFYIRVGCSKPNIEALVQALESISSGRSTAAEVQIVDGVESEENPYRPRPDNGNELSR
jgi:hypothetical protein